MDEFVFAQDVVDLDEVSDQLAPWKLLIVDDEVEVHAVTKLALRDFQFQDRGIEFISAYNGPEAIQKLADIEDIAVVLLDVVMETDDAGLKVARHVRDVANNKMLRIILRTGQPGQAPERDVILNYDINDYKSKTELTSQRLFTSVVTAFRSYSDLSALEYNRQGLERVIDASCDLFSMSAMSNFIDGLLVQLTAIFSRGQTSFGLNSFVAEHHGSNIDTLKVVAAQGSFSQHIGADVIDILPQGLRSLYLDVQERNEMVFGEGYIIYYRKDPKQFSTLVFVSGMPDSINAHDQRLIELFLRNVQLAYDNILLNQDIESTQREIVYRLGNALESRSKESGNHLKRVALCSELLGDLYGLTKHETKLLKLAAPLHDVGKIAIPDDILLCQNKLTTEQFDVMKTHAKIGYDLLHDSNRPILKAGANIAISHHERWDGAGYPSGTVGENIDLFGRIVSLVDVFDALYNKRCYKPAFELSACLAYIEENSGGAFDPKLVELFVANQAKFVEVMKNYPD